MRLRSRSVGMELVTVAPSGGSIANGFRLSTAILAGGRRFYARCGRARAAPARGPPSPTRRRECCSQRVVRTTDMRPSFSVSPSLFRKKWPSAARDPLASRLLSGGHDCHAARGPIPPSVPEPTAHGHPRSTRRRDIAAGEQPHLGPARAWAAPLRVLREADPRLWRGV